MPRLILYIAFALLLPSCAAHRQPPLENLSLPPLSAMPCCWQSQESIQLDSKQHKVQLLSALEVTPKQLTVVIFDPLGRRLAAFTQDDKGLHTLSAPPEWDTRLARQMLLAIYLHHIPTTAWSFENSDWTVNTSTHSRALLFHQQNQLQIDYPSNDDGHQTRRVSFPGQPLHLNIRTLTRTAL